MNHSLLLLVLMPLVVPASSGIAPAQAVGERSSAELMISGPQKMPLFRKGRGVKFIAILVNRSQSPIVLVPPHRGWLDEKRWLMWEAVDGNGHSVRRLPKILLACPLNLEMREHAVSETPMIPDLIQDSDLVVLQPGDKYAFPEIDDPSFSLKFLKRGTYRFTLKYAFEPSHYRLSIGSKKDALEKAVPLHLSSNTLAVTLY